MPTPRNNSDCCIAAIASATGVSYAKIKRQYGRLDRGGIPLNAVYGLLLAFAPAREVIPRKPVTLPQWLTRHPKGRYVVLCDGIFSAHAVAVVNGTVIGEVSPEWTIERYFILI